MIITQSCLLHIVVWIILVRVVPAFAASVQMFPSDVALYADTYIDLICDAIISVTVDTGVNISFVWTAHDSNGTTIDIREDNYTITAQSNYSTVRIKRLSISRDHMAVYNCLVSVTPSSESVYITGNESNIIDITVTVSGKLSVQNKGPFSVTNHLVISYDSSLHTTLYLCTCLQFFANS